MLLLERVLGAIRSGRFRPDETRSGRFVSIPKVTPTFDVKDESGEEEVVPPLREGANSRVEGPAEVDAMTPVTTDSSSESSSTGSPSSKRGPISFAKVILPNPPTGMLYWQRKKSRVLHLTYEHYSKVFTCGRSIGPHHCKLDGQPSAANSRCVTCAKIADEET